MSDPYVGQIMQVGFNYAPSGWATCQGQTLSLSQNQALFALIGTTFGGNGTTNFQLPDAQGRTLLGVGQGVGLQNYAWGQKGGTENTTLSINNLPSHTHMATFTPSGGGQINVTAALQAVPGSGRGATATSAPAAGSLLTTAKDNSATGSQPAIYAPAGTTGTPVNLGGLSVTASGGVTGGTVANALTGGSQPFSTLQPYLAVYTCIALQGVYPPRP